MLDNKEFAKENKVFPSSLLPTLANYSVSLFSAWNYLE